MGVFLVHQSHRLGVHELVQSPRRAGGTMSGVVAGQRLPTQGGLSPRRAGRAPPRAIDWARRNLFSSVFNSILTCVVLLLAWLILPPLFRWAVTHATISGMTRAACTGDGACWTFIRVRFPLFFYGSYPPDQRWRVDVAFALLVAFCIAGAARTGHGIAGSGCCCCLSCSRRLRRCCCGAECSACPTSTPRCGAG